MIAKFRKETKAYKALEAAAAMLTACAKRTVYYVDDVYFDLGQGWMWTTVIAHRDDGATWQALNPYEQDLITDICTPESICKAVCSVRASKWNNDK